MPLNFIVFSLAPWNINYGSNIKDLSVELSKSHNVVYVDIPLKRKDRWFKKDNPIVKLAEERIRSNKLLVEMQPGLWHYTPDEMLESVNSIKNNLLFDTINALNNRRVARSIRAAAKAAEFDQYILINDNDIYNGLHLKKLLNPSLYVYYLRDRLAAMSYWKAHVGRLEPSLIAQTDVVVANSEYLADYARQFNANSYYVGQGCDVTQFLKRPEQAAIDRAFEGIPKPIVGYVGALNGERLDINLLVSLATRMKDHSFVLVGPEDKAFAESELHRIPNVYFLGRKDFSELPVYMYGFDVSMNPQALNEITIGNYPRKVDEYLATGKPVVASETHAMNPFREYTYLGKNADDYAALISQAIREDNAQRAAARRAFACEHTWKNNTDRILEAIENTMHPVAAG